jgi:hypothetical protein
MNGKFQADVEVVDQRTAIINNQSPTSNLQSLISQSLNSDKRFLFQERPLFSPKIAGSTTRT